MDDFTQGIKYDLRETRFSQNFEHSIDDPCQQQDLWKDCFAPKSIFPCTDTFGIEYQSQQKQISKNADSQIYTSESTRKDNKIPYDLNQKKLKHQTVYEKFTKESQYSPFLPLKKQSLFPILNSNILPILNLQPTIQTNQNPQNNWESLDSDDVFSEKIFLIRSLQQKLSSLHQKIRLPTNSVNNYFYQCKNRLEKQHQTYSQSLLQNTGTENFTINQINDFDERSKANQNLSESKSLVNSYINNSLESESMLLDSDSYIYEKKISSTKTIETISSQPQIQIIETIRIVEIPYLIEINRETQDKIVSKKSFYFEENEDIHKTFQEFTQKQLKDEKIPSLQLEAKHDTSLQINEIRIFKFDQLDTNNYQNSISLKRQQLENSILSVNESDTTFHNEIKEKRDDVSFNYEEDHHRIHSKLESKRNQSQILELEEKVKFLEIQNSELKEKVKEFKLQKQTMEQQRYEFAEQLIRLSEFEDTSQYKLQKYKNRLQNLQEEFVQILYNQQIQLKDQYQRQIEQLQNEQSEYANRIITFQEIFEEKKGKEERFIEMIESQNEKIHDLQKICQQKDVEIEFEIIKRREIEQYVVKKQKEMHKIIENHEKENTQLKHIMRQMQQRNESEGFYIMNEEAIELKKILEEKDIIHIEELQKLENRYSQLIEKYQIELESMKRGLEKVRLNKSFSFSSEQNDPNAVDYYTNTVKRYSPVKKRENLGFTNISIARGNSLDSELETRDFSKINTQILLDSTKSDQQSQENAK